jgi:hypothetical protein
MVTGGRVLYHRTPVAAAIEEEGFRDGAGSYGLANTTLEGVFLSDVPLDVNEGAEGDDVLEVRIGEDVDLREYELVEDAKGYREWCVPASLLNERASIRRLTDEEVDDAIWDGRSPLLQSLLHKCQKRRLPEG